jgi:hypothetical protein
MSDPIVDPTPAAPAPAAPAPAAPAPAAPTAPAVTALDPLKALEKTFNRSFTEAELGTMLTWAEGKGNPALDAIIDKIDGADPEAATKALTELVHIHALAATTQPAVRSLTARLRKASLDTTARQPATPAPGPEPTPAEVTEALLVKARKTGVEPTVAEVLAANGITLPN